MQPWFASRTRFQERVNADDFEVFRRVCPSKEYPKGSHIFMAGDPASEMHIVVQGQVKLVLPTIEGKDRILAVCGADNFIGEAFLGEEQLYRVDAVALTDVYTCPMSRDQFVAIVDQAPTFALTVSEILAEHLIFCRSLLAGSYDPIKIRLVKAMLSQAYNFGEPAAAAGWYEFDTELTQEDMASMISATRVSVTMSIMMLRREGLIKGTRGRYQINVEGMEGLLNG